MSIKKIVGRAQTALKNFWISSRDHIFPCTPKIFIFLKILIELKFYRILYKKIKNLFTRFNLEIFFPFFGYFWPFQLFSKTLVLLSNPWSLSQISTKMSENRQFFAIFRPEITDNPSIVLDSYCTNRISIIFIDFIVIPNQKNDLFDS